MNIDAREVHVPANAHKVLEESSPLEGNDALGATNQKKKETQSVQQRKEKAAHPFPDSFLVGGVHCTWLTISAAGQILSPALVVVQ